MHTSNRLVVAVGMGCLAFTRLAVSASCEGDGLAVPESAAVLRTVESLATKGDVRAQAQMGMASLLGKGAERNVPKALSWLQKSAAGGSSEGQYLLGQYYAINGKSDEDFRKAASLFRQSADQDCIPALYFLALQAESGKGVPKNEEEGFRLLSRAAEAGYPTA